MSPKSDRERSGLRGPVKTCAHLYNGDLVSESEFAPEGRLLIWRGRIWGGCEVEQVYSYDESGRLTEVTADSGAAPRDLFSYDEEGRRTRIRTVPPRRERKNVGTGISVAFEVTEEGDGLIGGGTVITRYNDDLHPIESLVRDAHGELLTRIVHTYDDNGRLTHETLTTEGFELPEAAIPGQFREQVTSEQRQAMVEQLREQLRQWVISRGALQKLERFYDYDDQGRVARQRLLGGGYRISGFNNRTGQADP